MKTLSRDEGRNAVDVAELWVLYMKNDWLAFEEVGKDVKVFVQKMCYLVEIAGYVEKFEGSSKCHYDHILIALKN